MKPIRLALALAGALSLAGCGYATRPLTGATVLADLREVRATPQGSEAPATPAADASAGAPLAYEEAVAIAITHSPAVRAHDGEVALAEARIDAAGAWPASELRLNDFGFREGQSELDDFEVAFRWRLPHPFARGAAIDAARAEVPAERAERDEEAWDVRHDVRLTWAEAVAGRRRAALAAALARSAEDLVAQARRSVEQGVGDPLDVLALEVDALGAAERHEDAVGDARRATEALLRRLGRPDDAAIALPDGEDALRCPAPAADVAALEDRIAAAHPAVRRLEAEYTAAESLLEAAHDEQIPFLDYVQFGYGYDPRQAESGFTVSLSVELPIGAWSGGDLAVADARRAFVAGELRAAVARQADAMRAAVVRWEEAAAKVRWFAERVEPALVAAERRVEEAMAAGTATAIDALEARHKLLEMRLAALDALYTCHEAWVDAEHATGSPLSE